MPSQNPLEWRVWWARYTKTSSIFLFYIEDDFPLESGLFSNSSDSYILAQIPKSEIYIFTSTLSSETSFHTWITVNHLAVQAEKLDLLIKNYISHVLAKPLAQYAVYPSTHPKMDRKIASALEAYQDVYHLPPQVFQETIFKLALTEQRLGNIQAAFKWLDKLPNPPPLLQPQILLLKGKLESQQGVDPDALRFTLNALRESRFEISEGDRLAMVSSMLWRLSLSEALASDKNWERSIKEQLELSTNSYLSAHNSQCLAMIGVFNSAINDQNAEKHRDQLTSAFIQYIDFPQLPFIEKCLSSNLIFHALIHNTRGRYQLKLRCLLIARYLCEKNCIQPQHEAMRETLRLLGQAKEEFCSILFDDIRIISKKHSLGQIIPEIYLNICQRFCNRDDVLLVLLELLEEVA